MHELSITKHLLDAVIECAEERGATKVAGVSVEIGQLCDVVDDMVQRYFSYLAEGTIAEGALLGVRRTPPLVRCVKCGEVFGVSVSGIVGYACPACGGDSAQLVAGREMMIAGIEVE